MKIEKNMLLKKETEKGLSVVRALCVKEKSILVIDCLKRFMPSWASAGELGGYEACGEDFLLDMAGAGFQPVDSLNPVQIRTMHQRYTMISDILPFVGDEQRRIHEIKKSAAENSVSVQSVRHYLCLYLAFWDMAALAPQERKEKPLSEDEKNMRWALNRFYYNQNRNTLKTAYSLMLKEKYCDGEGKLLAQYPAYHQFRYFYSKTKKMQTCYISRDGIKDYQRNHRPLLGEGVQQFADSVGYGMLDSTVCDIYLCNEAGQIIGRPLLALCVDGFSGMVMGYSLSWEGGMYSLRNMLLNVVSDKKGHCKKFGIDIEGKEWPCSMLPGRLVTDRGSEYASQNFEQLADLGAAVINLSPFRPDNKSQVEKAFDVIQNYYKPYLKGKGVVEPDFQERGKHDYRRDASLTLEQFEAVILHCIIFYNSRRVLEDFPYTEQMLAEGVRPYPNEIFLWGCAQAGCNLIKADRGLLMKTLLPRTEAVFTRKGLKAGKLHYHNSLYSEEYLADKKQGVTVAYNPDDAGRVYLIENGAYIPFELTEKRYLEKSLAEVEAMKQRQKELVSAEIPHRTQAEVDLAEHI